MLRDMKLFRRNGGKKPEIEETENVPVKPSDVPVSSGGYWSRGPLSTIQDPAQCHKPAKEQELDYRNKIERTPTKVQGKGVNVRTPEKQVGFSSRNKFGWVQKNEAETRDEGKSDVNHLPPSTRGSNMTPRSVRSNTGRTTGNQSECSSTQSTPTKSVSKPPNPGFASLNSSRPNMNAGARAANFAAFAKGVPMSCASPLVVNNDTIDVPHFDLKEDPSFWMDHNVQVLIRVRPPNNMERSSHGHTRCLKQESAQTITWIGQPETRFTFDHVACETVNQEMLFRVAGLPMVENCLSGYNSCMFAYGQTGSGKTYTMLGEIDELEVKPSLDRGMTPRIFEFLFARIRAEEEIRRDEKLKYYCKCSFLEIYNEQIADLLDPSYTNLLLREDIKKGVYVENLTEYEVQSVNDIIKLLTEGSANRKVGATNMNRESSRSHSVFTCVIESRWEKDSTTNLRFARLNLVDLAGSERQKTSGAEGERLKEAANINKSLSTLGHVIMLLVDVAHGKLRHIPYRDSRLTFLLQESLGGNSKTMIIANVSPSICCSAETLSTLKFAQRAKLIQNNAVINEDASGDVNALQHQIQLLKEELSVLKGRNVSRTLSFPSISLGDTDVEGHEDSSKETSEMSHDSADDASQRSTPSGIVRVSTKQLKSLEATLAGAIRREQMAESSMKQLEAEIEQLNRLVNQREEDTRSTKMMLRFREDKIQRMESLLDSSMPLDSYLMEENTALYEEIQLLRAKIDKHPEVTRFALENIRLLDKLRRFQDFYEEGEREMLLEEVSELRTQLLQFLDGSNGQYNHQNANFPYELRKTNEELELCRNSLNSCLEVNAKLTREIDDLHIQLNNLKSSYHEKDVEVKAMRESRMDVQAFETLLHKAIHKEKAHWEQEVLIEHAEEVMSFQLELDILKIILQEERLSREKVEERAFTLSTEIEAAKARCLEMSMHCEDMEEKLKDSRAVTEALESQQILLINDLEGLRNNNSHYLELLKKQEQEFSSLREQICSQELRDLSALELSESKDSSLQVKLKRMQHSLEEAKRLNSWYQSDQAFKTSHEQEMDDIRKQVEVETAEVIISLQEELTILQQQVKDFNGREIETRENMLLLDIELKDLKDRLYLMTQDNKRLTDLVRDYNGRETESKEGMLLLQNELKDLKEKLCLMTCDNTRLNDIVQDYSGREIESKESILILETQLKDLEERLCLMTCDNMKLNDLVQEKDYEIKTMTEEWEILAGEIEEAIADGHGSLTDASYQVNLITRSLPHRNYINEQVGKILSSISEKDLKIEELQRSLMEAQNLKNDMEWKLTSLRGAALAITEAQQEENSQKEKVIQALRKELEVSEENCVMLKQKLSEEEAHVHLMEGKLEVVEKDILLKTRERLDEFKLGVSSLNLCMNEYVEQLPPSGKIDLECVDVVPKGQIGTVTSPDNNSKFQATGFSTNYLTKKDVEGRPCEVDNQSKGRTCEDVNARDLTIHLLRNEIESALESLKGVQAQMVKLFEEKEEISISEKQSKKSMECLTTHLLALQTVICSSEEQIKIKIMELEDKLLKLEESTEEVIVACIHKEKVSDLELEDAKVVAAQKTAEAASLLAKFEEAQKTMKEADIMVNALVIANDSSKFETEKLKEMVVKLTSERDSLSNQVESLELSNNQKDQLYATLEKQLLSDFSDTRSLVLSLEDIILDVQTAAKEQFESIVGDFQCLKSQILHSTNLTWSWLEDIWSEIVAKDCAMSVLHLCHMGVMLEAVNGLNVENGLLHHGMCESDSVIMTLKERNSKATKELEMFGILKGKLLVDIKNSFDRVSRNEDEARKLSSKLCSFGKRISDLHSQEELMLARSNSMGYELSRLIEELDRHTKNDLASLSDQIKFSRVKEELAVSQVDLLTVDLTAKDFESFVLASELQQIGLQKAISEHKQEALTAFLEDMKEELIIHNFEMNLVKHVLMDAEANVSHLVEVVEETNADKIDLSQKLEGFRARFLEVEREKKAFEQDIEALEHVTRLNDHLKSEHAELVETKEILTAKVQLLENESAGLIKDGIIKETALRASICELEKEMDQKEAKLHKLCSLEMENESLKNEVRKLKSDCHRVFHDLQGKKSEFETSRSHMLGLEQEKLTLQENICLLEDCVTTLRSDCEMKNRELKELQHSQSVMEEELGVKGEDLEVQTSIASSLKKENEYFRSTLITAEKNIEALLSLVRSNATFSMDTIQAVNYTQNKVFHVLGGKHITLLENVLRDGCENKERVSKLIIECKYLESCIEELTSENISFQAELLRKDDVLKGLLFDLSLLQESASNAKDQKDEVELMVAAVESLEDELALRSAELAEAIVHNQIVEALLLEKLNTISDIEVDLCKKSDSLKLLTDENILLKTQLEGVSLVKRSLEEELEGKKNNLEKLEEENFQMDNVLGDMNTLLEGLKNDLNKVTSERDRLKSDMDVWKEKLEQSRALAEEKEALAVEAFETAESRKTYAEDKEEEVKLLERSVEELESTINALENKADILKGEAERQRLLREELETELQVIKNQMITVSTPCSQVGTKNNLSGDYELQRNLEEKDRNLQETWEQIKALEKDIKEKDAEISQCRAHISELNLHAEAQAQEYKQKFKALEAMAEQVKPDPVPSHINNSSSAKLDKNASKSRGSGSPFKCIGLGLTQQINSEKDEELAARRLRIEELEALAASRQKEIFMLNARLAAAESMTHDVIRDLLGVKLDMNHYASMLDHQQVRRIAEKVHAHSEESLGKEQELVIKLKQQLKEFIEERQGWIDDINQKHADLLSAQISIEKLRQKDQSLTTENELLKKDIMSHKKKLMELEDEVKKLSGQQNLQQRIHHHAKIKEENNLLKTQIEDLSIKMQQKDKIVSRMKEMLAAYRASNGKMPSIDLDEEQRLKNKLKEAEDEKLQLAQKLLCVCTSVQEAAGLSRPGPGVSLVNAEEALEQLKDRFVSMEREVQDLKVKNRLFSERVRLSELKQQSSPFSSRTNDCTTPERVVQTPFFTAMDRKQ